MRTISSTLLSAINNEAGAHPLTQLVLKPSRVYAPTLSIDLPPSFADDGTGISDTPIPQDVIYHAASGLLISFSEREGYLAVSKSDTDTWFYAKYLGDEPTVAGCKPALTTTHAFCISPELGGHSISRLTLDVDAIVAGNPQCITNREKIRQTGRKAALHAISSTQVVEVYLDEGGIGITFYWLDGAWQWAEWPRRFMFPHLVAGDLNMTITAAAAMLDGDLFVYVSDWDRGCVLGVRRNSNGAWSDTFIAVPSDLSNFRVCNAFTANEKIHLIGQFERTEELDTGVCNNLVLSSIDGRIFSLDKFVLVTSLGYRFLGLIGGNKFWGYASNRIVSADISHVFTLDPPTGLTIPFEDIKGLSSRTANGNAYVNVTIANGDEAYSNHPLIKRGTQVVVLVGYKTERGNETAIWMVCNITQITKSFADGQRTLSLELTHEGIWKNASLNYPLYVEILGKDAVRDECEAIDNLYVAPASGESMEQISVDFWGSMGYSDSEMGVTAIEIIGGGGPECRTVTDAHKVGVTTQDLKDHLNLVDYPVIENTVRLKIYAWSRSDDPAHPEHQNDTFTPRLRVKKANDTIITVGDGLLVTPYNCPPESYANTEAGSDPIIYDFLNNANLEIGDKILSIALVIEAANTTMFLPVRIEVTSGISCASAADDANTPWTVETKDDGAEWLKAPGVGHPYIMFSQKPYDAFNFQAAGQFTYIPGETPSTQGVIAWGMVGLAEDAQNYVAARYDNVAGEFQLIKCRAGAETVLAFIAGLRPTLFELRHQDGVLSLTQIVERCTWEEVLSYRWTEADGALLPTPDSIAHVGIYAYKRPPLMHICSFNVDTCEGVVPVPGEDLSFFDSLPATGFIQIEGVTYSYSGKTPSMLTRGPYQARNTYNWPSGYGTYKGPAIEIAWFDWNGDQSLANFVLSSDEGHAYIVRAITWQCYIKTGGVKVWTRNRSRWFNDQIGGNYVGLSNRMCIGPALTGLALVDGESTTHPWKSVCSINSTDDIYAELFAAAGGDHDASIADMLSMLCQMAGTKAIFPGDYQIASVSLTADTDYPIP